MAISKDQITEKLRSVKDPEVHRDIVTLGAVKQLSVCDGVVSVQIAPAGGEGHDRLRQEAEAAIRELGGEIEKVHVEIVSPTSPGGGEATGSSGTAEGSQTQSPQEDNPLPNVKHVIAVGAGKGGVGKSTVAVNLAVGLARAGHRVGLMDGDIYGPSLPTMLGTDQFQARQSNNMLLPFELHGIKAMTIGALVDPEKPLIWRGPMAHGAFKQLATQTEWGELDYLIIDLPPGTGDVPLTMSQLLPLSGAVVVCTPQKVAQDDAKRAMRMFQQLGVEILGVVENMSYFIGDDGKEYDIFGRGGAELMAQKAGVAYLGGVPINMRLRENGDTGDPTANFAGGDQLATDLETVCYKLQQQVEAASLSEDNQAPTINIS